MATTVPGEDIFGKKAQQRSRAHLHSLAEVFSFAFLGYDGLIYLAGGDVMVSGESRVHKALIVPEIQICLATVIQDKHFAVLEGGHGSCIDVDVGINLDARHTPTSSLE